MLIIENLKEISKKLAEEASSLYHKNRDDIIVKILGQKSKNHEVKTSTNLTVYLTDTETGKRYKTPAKFEFKIECEELADIENALPFVITITSDNTVFFDLLHRELPDRLHNRRVEALEIEKFINNYFHLHDDSDQVRTYFYTKNKKVEFQFTLNAGVNFEISKFDIVDDGSLSFHMSHPYHLDDDWQEEAHDGEYRSFIGKMKIKVEIKNDGKVIFKDTIEADYDIDCGKGWGEVEISYGLPFTGFDIFGLDPIDKELKSCFEFDEIQVYPAEVSNHYISFRYRDYEYR